MSFSYCVVHKIKDEPLQIVSRHKTKSLADKRCDWLCNGDESAPFLVMELSEILDDSAE